MALVAQIDATYTLRAADTLREEPGIRTILTILTEVKVITIDAIDALVAEFASCDLQIVHALFRVVEVVGVETILVEIRLEDEVAIFAPSALVCVIRILIAGGRS